MQPLRLLSTSAIVLCAALGAGVLFAPDDEAHGSATEAVVTGETDLAAGLTAFSEPDVASDQGAGQPMTDPQPGMAQIAPEPLPEQPVNSAAAPSSRLNLLALSREAEAPAPEMAGPAIAAACTPELALSSEARAMIAVSYRAPCLSEGDAVVLRHGPLVLHETLDAASALRLVLPALAPEALVTVAPLRSPVAPGSAETPETEAEIAVSDFAAQARLVAVWAGAPALGLHAFVDDAGWGAPGHIHQASAPADGAFLTALGSAETRRSLVLTYPAGVVPHDGTIAIEADVALDSDSCGQRLAVNLLLVQPDLPVSSMNVDVDLPDCGSPGGFVFLGDVLPESPVLPETPVMPGAAPQDAPLPGPVTTAPLQAPQNGVPLHGAPQAEATQAALPQVEARQNEDLLDMAALARQAADLH